MWIDYDKFYVWYDYNYTPISKYGFKLITIKMYALYINITLHETNVSNNNISSLVKI